MDELDMTRSSSSQATKGSATHVRSHAGRGGTDTTAVALAATLTLSTEICSDVDGVTPRPTHRASAERLEALSHDERWPSTSGARVLSQDCVSYASRQDSALRESHLRPAR